MVVVGALGAMADDTRAGCNDDAAARENTGATPSTISSRETSGDANALRPTGWLGGGGGCEAGGGDGFRARLAKRTDAGPSVVDARRP